ncbi:MAG: hypothetical protein V7629_13850 [Motiliproteus sp.]
MNKLWQPNPVTANPITWIALFLALTPGIAASAETEQSVGALLRSFDALAIHDQELEQYRGGFVSSDGVTIAFGIADWVRIDGALVAEQSWHIDPASLRQIIQGGTTPGFDVNLIQGGNGVQQLLEEGLSVSNNLNSDTLAITTIVQNNQDSRIIETFRTINIDISKLGNNSRSIDIGRAYLRDYSTLSNF